MIINVYCPVYDKNFCLNVGLDLNVEDFKALCSAESGVSISTMKLVFNNQSINENKRTLSSYKICDNDMIVLEVVATPTTAQASFPSTAQASNPPNAQASPPFPNLDFSGIQVRARQQCHSRQN